MLLGKIFRVRRKKIPVRLHKEPHQDTYAINITLRRRAVPAGLQEPGPSVCHEPSLSESAAVPLVAARTAEQSVVPAVERTAEQAVARMWSVLCPLAVSEPAAVLPDSESAVPPAEHHWQL